MSGVYTVFHEYLWCVCVHGRVFQSIDKMSLVSQFWISGKQEAADTEHSRLGWK